MHNKIILLIIVVLKTQLYILSLNAQVILLEENLQNKTFTDLTDWHFDNPSSVTITHEGLKVGEGWTYTPLVSTPDGSSFKTNYKEVLIVISYTYYSPEGTWAPPFEGFLENNNEYPQQMLSDRFINDSHPNNRQSTVIYNLNDTQLEYNQLCIKFKLGWWGIPDLYIHSIKVSAIETESEEPLQADFMVNHNYITEEEPLKLYDISTGKPTSWEWQVKHSTNPDYITTSDSQEPEFTLTENGAYDISLTVWRDGESSTITKLHYVHVGCKAEATTTTEGHLSKVTILQKGPGIVTTSNASPYTFFDKSTEDKALSSLKEITVQVTASKLGTSFNEGAYVRVWCSEYSHCDIFNPHNYYDIPLTKNISTATGEVTFKPKITANDGKFILRLKLSADKNELNDPCQDVTIGEVEDYLLLIRNNEISGCQGNTLQFSEPGSHILIGDGKTRGSAIYSAQVNSFCIESWIKKDNYLDGVSIIEQGNSTSTSLSVIALLNELQIIINNQDYRMPITQIQPNSWFHFALVGTGEEVLLYINGNLIRSLPVKGTYFTNAPNDAYIKLLDDNFIGCIDETRFWATIRTTEQIRTNLYNALPDTDREQLLAYYQYNYNTQYNDNIIHDWHGAKHANIIGSTTTFAQSFLPYLFTPSVKNTNGEYDIFEPQNWSWDISELPHSKSMAIIAPDQNMSIATNGLKPEISSLVLSPGSNVSIDDYSYIDIKDSIVYVATTDKPASFLGLNRLLNSEDLPMFIDYTFMESRNWYVGPLTDATIFGDLPGQMYDGTNTDDWDFYIYDWDVKNGWQLITDTQMPILPAKGYLFHPKTKARVQFSGRITKHDYYRINTNRRGYHLVSNPYWAYLSLNELINGDHTGSNNFKEGVFAKSITLWTSINNERAYAHYNGVDNISVPDNCLEEGLVAPMQGFFLLNNTEEDATLEINNGMLTVPQGNNPSLKTTQKDNVIRIKISNQYAWYETAIAFHKEGNLVKTNNDTELRKVKNSRIPFIYTCKNDKANNLRELAINLQPDTFESLTIPIGFDISEEAVGEQALTINGITGNKELTAYFLTPEGNKINITDNQSINLNFNKAGNFRDYHLILTKELSTTTNTPEINKDWLVYSSKGKIVVKNKTELQSRIRILNTMGIQIFNQQINTNSFEYQVPSSGYYIIIINNDNTTQTFKRNVIK